ncbi:MAG: M67 family metallopeptidase, partial [Planctomycetota bacterium]
MAKENDREKKGKERFPGGDVRPDKGEFRICVTKNAYAGVMSHARETADIEVCGVLMGYFKEDKYGPYVHVTHVIRAEGAEHKGNQVTFTHEAWNHINRKRDAEHADRSMVGWYHTHPDFGIFLSEMDQFIHKNFFSDPKQVAYV